MSRFGLRIALASATAFFALLLFGGLSHPLMWQDEAHTAMFAERVLDYGYPKVHGPRNLIYALDAPLAVGVKEGSDAYIGSPWGQYYFATLGAVAARRASDPYTKTLLLRLPFALVGCAGLLLFLVAALPLLPEASRLGAATTYALLCAVSISLILHLREVRYYALAVFFGGLLVLAFRRREISGTLSPLRYGAHVVLALAGLFASYYPACLALGAGLSLDALFRGRPGFWVRIAPIGVAAALVLPAALFLEVPAVVAALHAGWDASFGAYARNLAIVGYNLARFEFLVPVLATKGLLWMTRKIPSAEEAGRQRLSGFLTLLLVVYWLVVARTPFLFERYFVLLSPLLGTLLLLDGSIAIRRLRARRTGFTTVAATVTALCLAGAVLVRAPELRGRLKELAQPVQGPLDVTIPYLAQRYDRPEELVIATNYEDPAYAYYLGSQMLVGFNAPALERDLQLDPDIVVPRRPRHREALEHFVRRGEYERKSFPIRNTRTNNVPSLSPHAPGGEVHRFETKRPEGKQAVVLFERRR